MTLINKRVLTMLAVAFGGLMLQGCLAAAVVGTTVGVAGAVVGTGVKATGAVVGAVIPDGDDEEEEERRRERKRRDDLAG
jgi:hypothetical protein